MTTKTPRPPRFYAFDGTMSEHKMLFDEYLERDNVAYKEYSKHVRDRTPITLPLPFKVGLHCESAKEVMDFTTHVGWIFYCSSAFRQLVEDLAPGAAQFLPIEQVAYTDKYTKHSVMEPYWLCNILKSERYTIDCIDFAYDESKPISPRYKRRYMSSAIFHPERVPPETHLFRPNQEFGYFLMVSEKFKAEFKARNLKGARFLSPEKCIAGALESKRDSYFEDFMYFTPKSQL